MSPNETQAIEKYVTLAEKSERAFRGGVLLKSLPLPPSRVLTWAGLYRLVDGGYHAMASKTVE